MIKKIIHVYKRDGFKRLFFRIWLKIVQWPRIFVYLRLSENKPSLRKVKLHQPALFSGRGIISLSGCNIGVWPSPMFFSTYAHIEARSSTASIYIGNGTWLNNNATIIADKSAIHIGNDVLIGHNFFVSDSDFHGLEVENRSNGHYDVAPVNIEDNVFIGANVTVLKGVTIGHGSVIASGAIVSSNIPENVLAGGVPAKIIKNLYDQVSL